MRLQLSHTNRLLRRLGPARWLDVVLHVTTLRGDRAWVNDFRETGYMVMFFPNRDVSEAEAVAGGTDQAIAHRIYAELAYLGSVAGMLVVVWLAAGIAGPRSRPAGFKPV